ncbi:MAG: Gfo/Idh/MocA family oxidoreductase [Planctomycetes bacterium]|nr:Gfo/Idh/MocA family oxidoreductase [Planctomycetota bacterium]
MAETKKAIIVGCGGMGQGWIGNVKSNPRSEVAALVDIRLEAATSAAEKFEVHGSCVFDDIAKAIDACPADFVVDVTTPESHCPTTVTALEAGLPVIGEKPMADSMDAARKMVAASEKSGKLYMVSQSRRYDVNHKTAQALVQSAVVGDITTINCDFYLGAHFGGFRDEMDSPLILDMSIHHFDMCRFLIDADPVAIYACEFNPKGSWYKGDVATSIIFEMTNDIVFTYRGSWCAEGCCTSWNGHWRIIGDRGTILMENDKLPTAQRVEDLSDTGFSRALEDVPVEAAQINGGGIEGSLNEMLDYLETGAPPQCECHDNIKSLAMVSGAIESSKRKQRIEVRI